jgi:hypothetical protein
MNHLRSSSIEDHIAIEPIISSDNSKYCIIHRANASTIMVADISHAEDAGTLAELGSAYHSAPGISALRWGICETIGTDLEREDALRKAREYASQRKLPIYIQDC